MNKLKKKNYKFNDKGVNNGLLFLFLAGCLLITLVGGYTLMVTYNNNKNKTISSDKMNISTTNKSVAEDGKGTATVVK